MTKVRAKHIDKSILYLFAGLSLLSVLIMAYKKATYISCEGVAYSIKNVNNETKAFNVGEVIHFSDFSTDAQQWQWDFGDSTEVVDLQEANHSYKEPGKYTVKLKVNDYCEAQQTIYVRALVAVVDSSKYPNFTLRESVYAGGILIAKDETMHAKSWEWDFGDPNLTNSTEKEPRFAYQTPGEYTVKLYVNGDNRYISSRKVRVYAKTVADNDDDWIVPQSTDSLEVPPVDPGPDFSDPPEIEDPHVEYNTISKEEMTRLIFKLSKDEISLGNFADNMCGGSNSTVTVNRKRITLKAFYEKIANQNIKVKEFSIIFLEYRHGRFVK